LFALRPKANPRCPVDRKMTGLLSPIFEASNAAVARTLRQTTLASLVEALH
jgi:hypothetical protein